VAATPTEEADARGKAERRRRRAQRGAPTGRGGGTDPAQLQSRHCPDQLREKGSHTFAGEGWGSRQCLSWALERAAKRGCHDRRWERESRPTAGKRQSRATDSSIDVGVGDGDRAASPTARYVSGTALGVPLNNGEILT
jgi:hypothetical protein